MINGEATPRRSPRIIYVQYTNPAGYPPLEHSSRILANAGWDVIFLGTGALGAGSLRFREHDRIRVRQLPYSPGGWRQKLQYLWFVTWVIAWIIVWRPTWVYASDLWACPVALLASFLPGVRLIYHEHDSPSPAQRSPLVRLCLWARKQLAVRVACCVLPNQERAKRFERDQGCQGRTICVWNCPSLEELSPLGPKRREDRWLRVLYAGSIVPSRLPESTIAAMACLPIVVKLRILGYETVGSIGYLDYLRELASHLGVLDNLEIVGTVPTRADMYRQAEDCDVGLALVPPLSTDFNERTMVGASNKPFDYLSCGLALLVNDSADWYSTYVDPGYGRACDPSDPRSVAESLQWFLSNPDGTKAMGARGRQRVIEGWNYEVTFEPVLTLIEKTVNTAKGTVNDHAGLEIDERATGE